MRSEVDAHAADDDLHVAEVGMNATFHEVSREVLVGQEQLGCRGVKVLDDTNAPVLNVAAGD